MSDDITRMTAELAGDPASLVFIRLADALRRRGQLDAALTVAERGLARYPAVADAHDLVARIHADRGDGDRAFGAWTDALRVAPDHVGAHKGLAFLAFRVGDFTRCRRHLERARAVAPDDPQVAATMARLRGLEGDVEPQPMAAAPASPGRQASPAASVPVELPAPAPTDQATLLFDQQGRVLRGEARRPDGADASEVVAAALAGVSREVERAARLLGLGSWRAVAVEGGPVNYEIRGPTPETLLLLMRGREVPAGRLSRIADRAVVDARAWLEALA
jgi:tetratricopeptide (TPR) repeat protein